MSRPHFNVSIAELEALVREHAGTADILRPIHDELTHRDTDRARRLRAEVHALLTGTLPAPSAPSAMAKAGDDTTLDQVVMPFTQTLPAERSSPSGLPTVGEPEAGDPEVDPVPSTMAGRDIPFSPATEDDRELPTANARARQIFRFLRDFAERSTTVRRTLREQLWTLSLADLPAHPSIEVGMVTTASTTTADQGAVDGPAALLRVQRPTVTQPPPPPAAHARWIRGAFNDPFSEPALHADRPRARRDDERTGDAEADARPVTERFADDVAREYAMREWLAAWRLWSTAEQPARQAMKVFEQLYTLLGRIERESEKVELVVGDGRLRHVTAAGSIDHPVLLQRVELTFDPGRVEFCIIDTDRAPELYGAILQGEDGILGDRLHGLQEELDKTGFHPMGVDGTEGFLKRITGLLGAKACFVEAGQALPAADVPSIRRDPVFILRQRTSGMPAAMARVLEDLAATEDVPKGLRNVVGIDEPSDDASSTTVDTIDATMTSMGEPADVLFAKPANLEQVQIARALQRHGAVLVQGPPGTGKSHTIANLIGHLVAQGNRVLVTSHTTKALRVLRQQVPETLRPLCVTLLEQDMEGRVQLEEAVRGIVERVGSSDDRSLVAEVARLTELRGRIMKAAASLHEQLRSARVGEYEPVVVDGEAISPVDAARLVLDAGDQHAWLPGPVTAGAPLPLSRAEIDLLYASNATLSRDEEHELEGSLPPRAQVLSADAFAACVAGLSSAEPLSLARYWEGNAAQSDERRIAMLEEAVVRLCDDLDAMAAWQRALVALGHLGEAERDLWRRLHLLVQEAFAFYTNSRGLLLDHAVERAAEPRDDDAAVVREIMAHLNGGGALGWMTLTLRPRWKGVLAAWRVNGAAPSRAEDFRAIDAFGELEARRKALATRWERQAVPHGIPPVSALTTPPETALNEYARQFDRLLSWWEHRWNEVETLMVGAGFRWASFREAQVSDDGPMSGFARDVQVARSSLRGVISTRLSAVRRVDAERVLDEQATLLRRHSGLVADALRMALEKRDADAWRAARDLLDLVAEKTEAWEKRRVLLDRLARDAREWAVAVRDRVGINGLTRAPDGVAAAWRWLQVKQELERRAGVDERAVALELDRCRTQLREVTCTLIDRMAWLAQLRRTDGPANRALIGWSDTQRRIAKGKGKRVPELQAKARELLSQARDAVPVWIMPLARMAENFDPRGRKFDVVIVDEASQSDVTGLLAFYMGKRVVVVGDNEQVSPSAVGQNLDDAQRLIAQHLINIPLSHLYDGRTSIYDLARQSFSGKLALREHFRCVPDIIEFSNHLAYSGQMRPLRHPSTAAVPHVVEYVVPQSVAGGGEGKVNLAEARAAAALIAAMISMPAYAGQSFGAITLLGDEQALQIQTVLLSLLGADRLQERRFAAGNSAQFQGDERDVVVLSMVDRPSEGGRPLPFRDTDTFKQRYNVAASRARNQLWLVHSLEPGRDLQPLDLRRRLIDHVRDPGSVRRAQAAATNRAESPFERAVIERLVSEGFKVTPQVEVGRYRIDMVISNGGHRVALECDGDRFHPPEQIPEDIARQAVLERAGWRFIRLRGTRFYRDPEGSMAWVFEELARLGVTPVGVEVEPPAGGDGATLREEVVRRAWWIMQERGWVPEDDVRIEAVHDVDVGSGRVIVSEEASRQSPQ